MPKRCELWTMREAARAKNGRTLTSDCWNPIGWPLRPSLSTIQKRSNQESSYTQSSTGSSHRGSGR